MATELPLQGKLNLPIEWSATVNKITQKVGGYEVQTTLGLNPVEETVSFLWHVDNTQMAAIINQFNSDGWLGEYIYHCPIRGDVTVRPQGGYSTTEDITGGIWQLTVDFSRIYS